MSRSSALSGATALSRALALGLIALALVTALTSCAQLRFVSEYDVKTFEETIRIGKRVDAFYGKLIELAPDQRTYSQFSGDYVDIEADIRSLVRRNTSRQLNVESKQISEDILAFWQQYKEKHKTKNAYPDARFDQQRFERLFNAAAAAEEAKKLKTGDKPAQNTGGQ